MQESAMPITRDAALRVALAARSMPGITLPKLIDVLQNRIGSEQIDTDDLRTVTVTDLKTAFASVDGEEDGEDIGIGLEAMKLAEIEAHKQLGEAMLISWYDRDRDFESPQHSSECHLDSSIPGYVDYGISHSAKLMIDIEDGRFVFFYIPVAL